MQINQWHVMKTGHLVKVKLIMYLQGLPTKALIESIQGKTQVVDFSQLAN